jgi:hypothetical protein
MNHRVAKENKDIHKGRRYMHTDDDNQGRLTIESKLDVRICYMVICDKGTAVCNDMWR